MVGQPNQISPEEVRQRTGIRFSTQTALNILHPTEGFNLWGLQELGRNNNVQRSSVESIIHSQIRATMQQDPDIRENTLEIQISRGEDRRYIARVRYSIAGSALKDMEYMGSMGPI